MPLPAASSALPLLTHWEAYAAECAATGRRPDLPAFAHWLTRRVAAAAAAAAAPALLAVLVAEQSWRYARVLRTRFQEAVASGALRTTDEFLLLAAACQWRAPGPSKTQLCRYVGFGATTGGQMLARLVAAGWLVEVADVADERCVRVVPTAAGRAAHEQARGRLQALAEELVRPLPGNTVVQWDAALKAAVYHHGSKRLKRARTS